jgi:hypothetical protein
VHFANYNIASSVLKLLASVVGMWLGYRLVVQGNMVQFPIWANDIALLPRDQTGHGAHSHLKPRLIMSGGICYLPYAIKGMHMDNPTFTFISVPALAGHSLCNLVHTKQCKWIPIIVLHTPPT